MKAYRWITTAVFALVLCGFLLFSWQEAKNRDDTYPQIKLDSEQMDVSVSVTEEELLEGVTASDDRDGDLTDRVLVESVSPFIEPGVCKVTYAVSDSSSHVAKASRNIHYTDYTPPRFTLSGPMIVYEDEQVNLRSLVGARDCIDGNISDRIRVVEADSEESLTGNKVFSVQVTNSRGDTASLNIPVFMEEYGRRGPKITLKQALLYVKAGAHPNFQSFVEEVTEEEIPLAGYQVSVSTNFDSRTPGVYSVHYYVTGSDGIEGHTVLTVVVEE